MTQSDRPASGRVVSLPGRSAVFVAAAGVFGVLLVQRVLLAGISTLAVVDAGNADDVVPASAAGVWLRLLQDALVEMLPFSAGVFLVLWLLLPIEEAQRPSGLLVRGLVAAVGGMLAVIAVVVLLSFLGPLGGLNPVGYDFPQSDLGWSLRGVWAAILDGATGALGDAVIRAPLVVLAAVLLWLWQRRRAAGGGTAASRAEV